MAHASSTQNAVKKRSGTSRPITKLGNVKRRAKANMALSGSSKTKGIEIAVAGIGTFQSVDDGSPGRGKSIGSSYGNVMEQLRSIKAGLPTRSITSFQKSTGLPVQRITALAGISSATYSRRKQRGRLTAGESERMFRLSRIFERAIDLYRGDKSAAMAWLETPIESLGGTRPLDMTRTEPGAREVENLISRIQHGVIS